MMTGMYLHEINMTDFQYLSGGSVEKPRKSQPVSETRFELGPPEYKLVMLIIQMESL
jgi:hypothetical protein